MKKKCLYKAGLVFTVVLTLALMGNILGATQAQAAAEVTSLWPVSTVQCGQKARLWAQVRNTGNTTLPSSARVWYWVGGPSGPDNYVGSVGVG